RLDSDAANRRDRGSGWPEVAAEDLLLRDQPERRRRVLKGNVTMNPKRNSLFTIVGLLVFFLLCLVPSGQAQSCIPVSQGATPPWQLGVKCVFTSASAPVPMGNVAGLNY